MRIDSRGFVKSQDAHIPYCRNRIEIPKKRCPGIRLVISFADTQQGHAGTIYQTSNWLYAGTSVTHGYLVNGTIVHPKTVHSRYGKGGQSIPWLREHVDANAERCVAAVKHRYLFPLDSSMKRDIEPLRMPYPKRVPSADSGTSCVQQEGGGAIPTGTL